MEKLTFETLRKKKAFAVAGIGLTALTLSGCAPSLLTETKSTVISHEYDDPDFYMVGKVPMWDKEHFLLNIQQCGREGEEYVDETGCVVRSFEVSEETYGLIPDNASIIIHVDENDQTTIEQLPR